MEFYPQNFPRKKEKDLVNLFRHLVEKKPGNKKEVNKFIRDFLKKSNIKDYFPSYWHLNFIYWRFFSSSIQKPKLMELLIKHSVRSLSGIVPLSLFTKPTDSCPFNCLYCPTERGVPKSYFNDEAAIMRASRNGYDPYMQTQSRLIQFFLSSHPIDKVDVIIQGGTFSFYEKKYREEFVKEIYKACNQDIEKIIKFSIKEKNKTSNIQTEKKKNEKAKSRVVGLTVETRPDFINKEEIVFLRKLGVTRVELGVQSLDDKVLKLVKRGHTIGETINATKLLKEAGFKVTYHIMPGLPGSNMRKDIACLRKIFGKKDFQPDSIKFYPTQVVNNSELYEWYKKGIYKPFEESKLFFLTKKFKKEIIPKWVRIHRLVRDLTKNDVAVTTFPSNFRQEILARLDKEKIKCCCIRCREIKGERIKGRIKINTNHYPASDGREYFIEGVDDNDRLVGFLRLRIPEHFLAKQNYFIKDLNDCVIIRELHVYGQQIPVGAKGITQHIGLGTELLLKAEKIAKKHKAKKIAVISGIGVREYYRKFGYEKKDEYMIKSL